MSRLANISVAAALEKSKLASDDPWIPLVKITWPDGSQLRLARYPEDVQFGDGSEVVDGVPVPLTYTAFSWEFSELTETSDGSIPTWGIQVSNVNRAVEALLEEFGGGVGGSIVVYVVQASRLKREPDFEFSFDIIGASSDAQWVKFTLGASSPLRILFGRHPYTSDTCSWRYKSIQCGYTGTLPSCSFTLGGTNGCRAHSNSLRFGAYPGIDSNGLRVVSR